MSRVYPRLALSHALEAAKAVRELFAEGGSSALSHAAAFSHPHAAPVATGGRVATPQEIERAREEVLEAMAPLLDRREVPTVKFDVVLGKSLHEALDIVPGDAAHDETWSFLEPGGVPRSGCATVPRPARRPATWQAPQCPPPSVAES